MGKESNSLIKLSNKKDQISNLDSKVNPQKICILDKLINESPQYIPKNFIFNEKLNYINNY